ncbi:enoyl-CoA hydratase/isomerase family protein [Shewanella waksmanii]|uniref:enoyl-CoA hydratase/isomerase family protein n=1 Tax=Shewanella waksmanii TaxID=213783 RepID=UPI003736BFC6
MKPITNDVVFQTLGTISGKQIGVVTLNVEKALNALNLDMVQAMLAQLRRWQDDDTIAMVVMEGAGDKAFCAGGDVRALHQAAIDYPGEISQAALTFFEQEYRLDYLLHTYNKPVLVWADGIVMGGGVGLMAGASHRVVTEHSRVAMPEVTIGLYPDVGGSYFLNTMPGKVGLFLGLTAYNMTGSDAHYVGLGNHYLNREDKHALLEALSSIDWSSDDSENHGKLDKLLAAMSERCQTPMAESVLALHQQEIDALMAGSIADIASRLNDLTTEEKWLSRAVATFQAGSPISHALIFAQANFEDLSLAQAFQFELGLSVQCCAIGDFAEGVRALLIDKDRNPQWLFPHVERIAPNVLSQLLASPWDEQSHPLADLA